MANNQVKRKMKKIVLMSLFLVILGICKVNAQTKYSVTVSVEVTHKFYTDEDCHDFAFESVMGEAQTILVCADTPYDAEKEAIHECDKMCSRNTGRKLGSQMSGGKKYYVREFRKVYEATAKKIGDC